MHVPAWDIPTDDAKDLVMKMLTLDPMQRIDMEGILSHPWLAPPPPPLPLPIVLDAAARAQSQHQQMAPPRDREVIKMGPHYQARIKSLVFRNKLKRYFISNNIEAGLLSNTKEAAEFYFAEFDRDRDGFVGLEAMVSLIVSHAR